MRCQAKRHPLTGKEEIMTITPERFEQGFTYEQYKAQMTRNQDRFEANERELTIEPADLAAFQKLPQTVNVFVLAEDWCGDVVSNLPILGRLAAESGKLNVRIFLRDQNLDIMDHYLKEGQFRSIPVFVFLDQQFTELGVFIERPASVTERLAAVRAKIHAEHPEFGAPETPISQIPEDVRGQMMQVMASMREATKTADNQDVVSAIRAIVEQRAA